MFYDACIVDLNGCMAHLPLDSSRGSSHKKPGILGIFESLRFKRVVEEASSEQNIATLLDAIKSKNLHLICLISKEASYLITSGFSDFYPETEEAKDPKIIDALLSGIGKEERIVRLSLLMRSAISKDSEFWVGYLLEQGLSPLHEGGLFAALGGIKLSKKSLKVLSDKDPESRYWVYKIALVAALDNKCFQFAKWIIETGEVDIWQDGVKGFYPNPPRSTLVGLSSEKEPLVRCVAEENLPLVEIYLRHIKGPNKEQILHRALVAACKRESSALFRMIVDAGADINQSDGEILDSAIKNDKPSLIGFYLSEGAELTSKHFEEGHCVTNQKTNAQIFLNHLEPVVCGAQVSTIKQVQKLLPNETPKIVKTDAMDSSLSLQRQPVIAIYIRSSLAAGVLSDYNPSALSIYTSRIFAEDVRRVENTKGLSWSRYRTAIEDQRQPISGFADIINEVAGALVMPIVIKNGILGESVEDTKELSYSIAADLLSIDKSTLDLSVLNARWHRAGNRCPDDLRPYLAIGDWIPLFDDPVDVGEGFTVECLYTPSMLKDEGSAMSHCVGSYANACRNGASQILSVRKHGQSQGTIELVSRSRGNIIFGNERWEVAQFRGVGNQKVSDETEQAFERFLIKVDNEGIKSSKRINSQVSRISLAVQNALEREMGFAIEDAPSVRMALLAHYDERVFVERGNTKVLLLSEKAKELLNGGLKNYFDALRMHEAS